MKKIIIALLLFNAFVFGNPGKLVIIDGLSSSGKTTIISSLIPQLDETYEAVALDSFVTKIFLERDSKNLSEKDFQVLITKQKQKMFEMVINKVTNGKNVLLDTVLFGFNGNQDFLEYLDKFKDLDVIQILAYCPLGELTNRMIQRNELAKKENNRSNHRPLFLTFKYNQMFKKYEEGDVLLGHVFYSEIERAYKLAKDDNTDKNLLDRLKAELTKSLSLDQQECVNISSKIQYDYFVDTSLNSPTECANKIQKFLFNSTPNAFLENRKIFVSK